MIVDVVDRVYVECSCCLPDCRQSRLHPLIETLSNDAPDGEGGYADRLGERGGSGNDGQPPQKRTRDAKYAIPTMEEACLLRETEGKLFEGNLLRLEVEELLGAVRVDHGKKSVKALEVRPKYTYIYI